jgi:hypothetical protein
MRLNRNIGSALGHSSPLRRYLHNQFGNKADRMHLPAAF